LRPTAFDDAAAIDIDTRTDVYALGVLGTFADVQE
jgi:hypothetical protein